MTNNKKLEEKIQSVIGNPFDSTHIMSVFTKELNSLLQEIEEKVIGEEIKHSPQITNAPHSLGCRNCRLNKLKAQQRKALKTIKERYL